MGILALTVLGVLYPAYASEAITGILGLSGYHQLQNMARKTVSSTGQLGVNASKVVSTVSDEIAQSDSKGP